MNTKTLIFSILGIFAVSVGSFFVISPIAKQALYDPMTEQVAQTRTDVEIEATTTAESKSVESEVTPPSKPTSAPVPSKPTSSEPVPSKPVPADSVVAPGYTSGEVAQHSSESSCWSIIEGSVYDLTSYVPRHPGGKREILNICGRDGTSLFDGQHGGDSKPERILAGYLIGPLK